MVWRLHARWIASSGRRSSRTRRCKRRDSRSATRSRSVSPLRPLQKPIVGMVIQLGLWYVSSRTRSASFDGVRAGPLGTSGTLAKAGDRYHFARQLPFEFPLPIRGDCPPSASLVSVSDSRSTPGRMPANPVDPVWSENHNCRNRLRSFKLRPAVAIMNGRDAQRRGPISDESTPVGDH